MLINKDKSGMKIDFITPAELNSYSFFCNEFEGNPYILFHATPLENLESILVNGFQSAAKLEKGHLTSISFAKKSSYCLGYMGKPIREDFCVFVVEFPYTHPSLNTHDMYVYMEDESIQPTILGYCLINEGFDYI